MAYLDQITDDQLLSGMASFLVERHGPGTLTMVERRIAALADEDDELAFALWKGVAVELRRMNRSNVKH